MVPTAAFIGGNKIAIIADYDPIEGKICSAPVEMCSLEAISQGLEGLGVGISYTAKPLPNMKEIEDSLRNGGIIDLSESLAVLPSDNQGSEAIAESLLKNKDVREKFADKEELIAILCDLIKLRADLKKSGCSDLGELVEKFSPHGEKEPESIESGWIAIKDVALHRPHRSRLSSAWSMVKGSYHYGSKAFALYCLLRDPRTVAVLNGLKWLALLVVL